MTNPLIIELRIREQGLKKQIQERKIKIARLINELSVYIATYYGDMEEIDAEKIKQTADELFSVTIELNELVSNLKKLQKELA